MHLPLPIARRYRQGFTLIELMVAVAIVGILAMIAYPSYQSYLVKGRRAAAQAHLMDIAQRQQQYLLDARSYASNLTSLNMTTPSNVATYYDIAIDPNAPATLPAPRFTATATPRPGTLQAGDVTLTIDNTGQKTPATNW